MTSASELFYNRRSRTGRNADSEFSSSPDRNPHLHNHYNHRHYRNNRHEEDWNPFPRRSSHGPPHGGHLSQRVSQTERESIQLDHNTSQPGTGSSSSTEAPSSRANRPRFTRNDRLPGAVLQARERLLERLRGVSITGNRQSSTNSGISWDEFAISDDFRVVDTGDWETEIHELFAAAAPFTDTTVQGGSSSIFLHTSKTKPPGLSREAINSLQREVFNVAEGDRVLRSMLECCICLESFQNGDELIYLPCEHSFHPQCLDPWVQTCGDCPYCRMGILVDCVE